MALTSSLAASRVAAVVSLALTAVSLVGCDSSGRVVPVSGVVTEDGKALAKGSVTYHPEGKSNAVAFLPTGAIDENGKYSLTTNGKTGAPPGKYKVVVIVQVPSNPKDPYSIPKPLVNALYTKPETTTLTVEVKDSPAADEYDLKLKK